MDKSDLQLALESIDPDAVRSYSGRSMYGKECLAITTSDSPFTFFATMLDILNDDCSDECECRAVIAVVTDALMQAHTDSMGMGTVIYFPGIPFVK